MSLADFFINRYKMESPKIPVFDNIADDLPYEKSQNEIQYEFCKSCNSNKLIKDDGYVKCFECGMCNSPIVSNEAEWINYADSVNRSRCGPSNDCEINPFINSLATYIPKGSKSFITKNGKYISSDISNIHIQNSYNHLQRSFAKVENLFDNISTSKYPPTVITIAKKLWAEVCLKHKLTRSGPRKGLIASCLYYACVHYDCPRTPFEICEDFKIVPKDFNKGQTIFKEVFSNIPLWNTLILKNVQSETYFNRFCCKLEADRIIEEGTSFQLYKKCLENYEKFKDVMTSVNPKSSVCGTIFYTCRENQIPITKTKLSKEFDICIPTITKVLNLIDIYVMAHQ
jgi:transcription initiation factor TFIIIB Brf1 subunit/transcription initiation factor TFIIB